MGPHVCLGNVLGHDGEAELKDTLCILFHHLKLLPDDLAYLWHAENICGCLVSRMMCGEAFSKNFVFVKSHISIALLNVNQFLIT